MRTRLKYQQSLMTHKEAADRIGVEPETLWEWVKSGEFPDIHSTIKRTSFFRREVIDHYIETGLFPDGTKFREGEGRGRTLTAD